MYGVSCALSGTPLRDVRAPVRDEPVLVRDERLIMQDEILAKQEVRFSGHACQTSMNPAHLRQFSTRHARSSASPVQSAATAASRLECPLRHREREPLVYSTQACQGGRPCRLARSRTVWGPRLRALPSTSRCFLPAVSSGRRTAGITPSSRASASPESLPSNSATCGCASTEAGNDPLRPSSPDL